MHRKTKRVGGGSGDRLVLETTDTVDLGLSTFYCNARFDGGPGTDTLHRSGAHFLGLPPVIVNFETVN